MNLNDQYFKTLLQNHFEDFFKFCFPSLHSVIDFTSIKEEDFLSQEQLAEIDGKLHRLDMVTKVKLKGKSNQEAFAIIFIESQHQRNPEFPHRVLRYFCLLYLKYGLTIIPVVIYSDKHLWQSPEDWKRIQFEIAHEVFFELKFFVYKPSLTNIKDYLRSTNPVALALAPLMKYDKKDLLKHKMQLIRQLNQIAQPQNKILELFKFIDHYMESDEEDFEGEIDIFKNVNQSEDGMLVEYFTNEGLKQGLEQGQAMIIQTMLANNISWTDITRMTEITPDQFNSWKLSITDTEK